MRIVSGGHLLLLVYLVQPWANLAQWTRNQIVNFPDIPIPAGGNGAVSPQFGKVVSLSADGGTMLVGVPRMSFVFTTPSGGQEIRQRGDVWQYAGGHNGTWTRIANLTGPIVSTSGSTGAGTDWLAHGSSICMTRDGTTAFIGAPGSGFATGRISVWARTASGPDQWNTPFTFTGIRLSAPGTGATDRIGSTLACAPDGSAIAAGTARGVFVCSPGSSSPGSGPPSWSSASCNGPFALPLAGGGAGTQSQPPDSIALTPDLSTMLVGSASANNSMGVAAVFARLGTGMPPQYGSPPTLLIRTPGCAVVPRSNSNYGQAVALSDDGVWAVVGSPSADLAPGWTVIFQRQSGSNPPNPNGGGAQWLCRQEPFSRPVQFGDAFGTAIAINSSSTDGRPPGILITSPGQYRAFIFSLLPIASGTSQQSFPCPPGIAPADQPSANCSWSQTGVVASELLVNSAFGGSVAWAGLANRIAVGSPGTLTGDFNGTVSAYCPTNACLGPIGPQPPPTEPSSTATATASSTASSSATATATMTPGEPATTATATGSASSTATASATATATESSRASASATASSSASSSATASGTATATFSSGASASNTPSNSPSGSYTSTATSSASESSTPTPSTTPSNSTGGGDGRAVTPGAPGLSPGAGAGLGFGLGIALLGAATFCYMRTSVRGRTSALRMLRQQPPPSRRTVKLNPAVKSSSTSLTSSYRALSPHSPGGAGGSSPHMVRTGSTKALLMNQGLPAVNPALLALAASSPASTPVRPVEPSLFARVHVPFSPVPAYNGAASSSSSSSGARNEGSESVV